MTWRFGSLAVTGRNVPGPTWRSTFTRSTPAASSWASIDSEKWSPAVGDATAPSVREYTV